MDDQYEDYPSLDLAYAYVPESFATARGRMEVIDGRIGAVVSLVIGVTLGFPAFVRGVGLSVRFAEFEFLAAVAIGFLIVAWGLVARNTGTLRVVDIEKLRRELTHLTPPAFRAQLLYFAAKHFPTNMRTVRRKAFALDLLTGLWFLQVVLLVWWIAV